MKAQVGIVIAIALVAASGCTKQSAGIGAQGTSTASTPESMIIQQATQAPASQAALPAEPAAATTADMMTAAAPVAPVENTAAAMASSTIGSSQEIQRALQQAGFYHGAIDGKIGPKTLQAIKAFQQAHQLRADGKVGPRTWAALQSYLTASAPSSSATSTTSTQ